MNGQPTRNMTGPLLGLIMALISGGIANMDDATPTLESFAPRTTFRADRQPAAVASAVEDLLAQLDAQDEGPRTGYSSKTRQKLFPHWGRFEGCTVRQRVLIDEREAGEVQDCVVIGGEWFSIYDALVIDSVSRLQIDHMVPLAEAWDSGASGWDTERRRRFANDLGYEDSLIAVTGPSNGSKGDQDPAEWKPRESSVWCRYATAWTTVKIRWGLSADNAEVEALRQMFDACDDPPPTDVAVAE